MAMPKLLAFAAAAAAAILLSAAAAAAELLEEDKLALLDFAAAASLGRDLNWVDGGAGDGEVCRHWVGITCSSDGRRVTGVRLPGVSLSGTIPPATLSRLSALEILSLRSNFLSGPFPAADLAGLAALTVLHLQLNSFSGPLPSDFSPWPNLTNLDLSFNLFNGTIPPSISNLTRLAELNLSNNSLSGEIPELQLPELRFLNLSDNLLTGAVPEWLQRFPSSSFSGNVDLSPAAYPARIPPPLPGAPSPPPIPSLVRRSKKLGEAAILGIVAGGCALAFAAVSVFLLLCCSSKQKAKGASAKGAPVSAKGERSPEKGVARNPGERNRLVFFEGSGELAFDLEDLLRASAEVLGKGTFGTAYKAVLDDSTTVVVKRLKDVGSGGRREFEQHMQVVGKVRHANVVELKAYYFSKEEKLIVYDYYLQGSVSALLHGKSSGDRTPLDWDTRLKIALGAARGLARIHAASNGKLIHGNVKSSNIFLNADRHGCVSDAGLPFLMSYTAPRSSGYRAPEAADARRATQASDVYSLGVVVLELLTGRSPVQATGRSGEAVHLVRWVQSVVREEWTAEVFDVELMKYPNIEEEMVELLQVAMACVARAPERRPRTAELARMIEDVRRPEASARPSSEASSSPPMTTRVQ